MIELTSEQRAAVEVLDRPMAVIAAAGSGKTRVLVERYLALLSTGLSPSQILAVTFTNEAADQLKERIVLRLMEKDPESPLLKEVAHTRTIGTLHSFCFQVLNRYSGALNLPPISSILTPFELAQHFEQSYTEWLNTLPATTLKQLVRWYTPREMKELAEKAYRYRRLFFHSQTDEESGPVVDLFRSALRPLITKLETEFYERGVYGFDDLEALTVDLLEHHSAVRDTLSNQLKAYLVDEFQDTSPAQWKLLTLLTGNHLERLFVVGDPKQSIYRFRRADLKLFESVATQMKDHQGEIIPMDTNFRTYAPLLEMVNGLSASLFSGSPLSERAMKPGRTPDAHLSDFFVHRYPSAATRAASTPMEIACATEVVTALHAEHPNDSIALLFRVSDKIPQFEAALVKATLPALAKTAQSLFRNYGVLDVVNYLEAINDPLNDVTLAAFLRSPYGGYSYQALLSLFQFKGASLFDKLRTERPGHLQWYFDILEEGELRLGPVLQKLFQHSHHFPLSTAAFARLWQALEGSFLLPEALEKIRLWKKQEISFSPSPVQDRPGGIRLMTVHAAKGLEFDHVLLVDNLRQAPRPLPPFLYGPGLPLGLRFRKGKESVETSVYQNLKEQARTDDLEESKRVLYVALTRAIRTLHVFLPQDEKLIPKETWGAWLSRASAASSPTH